LTSSCTNVGAYKFLHLLDKNENFCLKGQRDMNFSSTQLRYPVSEEMMFMSFHLTYSSSGFFFHGKKFPLTYRHSSIAGHKITHKVGYGFPPGSISIRQ
jgi:hypothetical protein